MKTQNVISTSKFTSKAAALLLLTGSFYVSGLASADSTSCNCRTPGYLKVFSATQQVQWGEGSFYNPHTGYRIFSANGTPVKWVENQDSITDQQPQSVELAPGTYTIWAQSEDKRVRESAG